MRNDNAGDTIGKQQSGSLSHRLRLNGNDFRYGPPADQQKMITFIRGAIERGVTSFETAEAYDRL